MGAQTYVYGEVLWAAEGGCGDCVLRVFLLSDACDVGNAVIKLFGGGIVEKNPVVSVIVPVYKTELYLEQCVESILNQTYSNLEVILVDDGSPDRCPEICDQYADMDARVKVIHKKNGGLSDARNAGIQLASGDYITFLDSDDFWCDRTALGRLASRLQITHPDVLNYSYVKCNESGIEIAKQFDGIEAMPIELKNVQKQLSYLTSRSLYIASACNKLIKKDLVFEIPFEKGKTSEDIAWCAQLMKAASSFDFICENFYFYRQHGDSITHSFDEKNCVDLVNNICDCIGFLENTTQDRYESLSIYVAYQFATFFAVQALASKCPKECIEKLRPRWRILCHCGSSKKVKCLYIGCWMIGFTNMCRLTKLTRKLWA